MIIRRSGIPSNPRKNRHLYDKDTHRGSNTKHQAVRPDTETHQYRKAQGTVNVKRDSDEVRAEMPNLANIA